MSCIDQRGQGTFASELTAMDGKLHFQLEQFQEHRAMRRIYELERKTRRMHLGAIGFTCLLQVIWTFAIAIRTMILKPNNPHFRLGRDCHRTIYLKQYWNH